MRFRRIRYVVRLISVSIYFMARFVKYSGVFFIGERRIKGHIFAVIHGIEKGINMPDRRNIFSVSSVEYLIALNERYSSYLGSEPQLKGYIVDTLVNWMEVVDTSLVADDIASKIARYSGLVDRNHKRSQKELTQETITSWLNSDYPSFASSRRSVRCFDDTKIAADIVTDVVTAAHNSASVCNRNLPEYFLIDASQIKSVLEIQGGASGFLHRINNLGIICYHVDRLYDPEEYRQGMFDAGLFAQCLSFEFQSRGFGSVFLNWAQTPTTDRKLRQLVKLPETYEVCCLIGFGVPDINYTSPRSLRI
jgi:hypothetical protein